ncbi:MAG: helix-turn-helix domain-containing protein [Sulfuricurvum sp.]|uniref:helix-turn-helix domain-containing protein n=1 Tax=Sulfuricurvum sp. TaxID=2025608 RepID=UPI002633BF6A|nr:helix-turn-helix domain-containing protein [Sulfuricurvum sp.]MDD2830426.1 helix-turn-helix domain-containing protein [Sulfuricurvum sp.]MDD4950817.1 helix-turn-helix domain-containing protein [Sulfuricurvum sp.]
MSSLVPLVATDYIQSNFKEHTITANGIILAKYFSVTDHYRSEAFVNQHLLNIVLKGEKHLHIKSVDIVVRAGEAFFLARGEYIMSEMTAEDEYACLLIFFDDTVALNLFRSIPTLDVTKNMKSDGFFRVKLTDSLQAAGEALLRLTEEKPKFADELLILKLQEIILLLASSDQGEEFSTYFKSSMFGKADLALFMNENFTQTWSLSEFAQRSGRSLSAFKSDFFKLYATTPMEWLWGKRLEKAKFLIENGWSDIGEAAYNCGFKSHSHFTRMFKERYAQLPKKLQG